MRSTPPVQDPNAEHKPGQGDLLVRPATPSDIDDFYQLARLAGAGFTSLPANEALLAERLAASVRAFAGEPGILMLALEDRRSKSVVGCAAIKPGGEPRPDFLNFHIDGRALRQTARYADMTEVGSLLLHPDYRNGGIGPWLARSRYLLIAADPERFGAHIFSELRGMVVEDDRSPFYDAVCAPHFGCTFAEADDLCAHGRQAELNARLPQAPISLHGLIAEARTAMGQPHRSGRRALDYLEDEGFRFEGVVDLLDGGPAVVARLRSVKTISTAFRARLRAGRLDEAVARPAYLALGSGMDYRCCRASVEMQDETLVCSPEQIALLGAHQGAVARVFLTDDGKARESRDIRQPALSRPKTLAELDAILD
ncbi:MAG: arginine N-succinyltransferase [Alphaproteobacteria bacterium]|nr:arginine N-succinyltransferase [Alphaproteobacteria bacterium]